MELLFFSIYPLMELKVSLIEPLQNCNRLEELEQELLNSLPNADFKKKKEKNLLPFVC